MRSRGVLLCAAGRRRAALPGLSGGASSYEPNRLATALRTATAWLVRTLAHPRLAPHAFSVARWGRYTAAAGLFLLAGTASAQDAGVAAAEDLAVTQAVEETSGRLAEWITEHVGSWGRITVVGVEAWRLCALFGLLLLTFLGARMLRVFLDRFAKRLVQRTRWQGDDLLLAAVGDPASLFVHAIGLYVAVLPVLLKLSGVLRRGVGRICLAIAAAAVVWYLYRVVDVVDHYLRRLAGRTDNDLDDTFVDIIRKTMRVFLVIVAVLFIGQSILQLKITALLASAGIAGLAIAFAAQDTIANFFGSFMLLLDRPFKTGERVVIEDIDGAIESIGFRSTRIRTLDGHQVSIPNKLVADAKIENVGRRPHIKRVSNITITYDTPVAKVEKAVQIIKEVLHDHRGMDAEYPPRVYFNDFNDWALNIMMVAWYHPGDYWGYLQWCEETNLAIMRRFEEEGIEFAFPTTTQYVAHDPKRPLSITTLHQPAGSGAESAPGRVQPFPEDASSLSSTGSTSRDG